LIISCPGGCGVQENELSVAPTLLQVLNRRGKVVMGDAMRTQHAALVQIGEAGGNDIWLAKDNQPAILRQHERGRRGMSTSA
jgi:hypothetical protein